MIATKVKAVDSRETFAEGCIKTTAKPVAILPVNGIPRFVWYISRFPFVLNDYLYQRKTPDLNLV